MYLTFRCPFLAKQDRGLELHEKLSSGGGAEKDDVHATTALSSRYGILL